jgi:hypothetical protein
LARSDEFPCSYGRSRSSRTCDKLVPVHGHDAGPKSPSSVLNQTRKRLPALGTTPCTSDGPPDPCASPFRASTSPRTPPTH